MPYSGLSIQTVARLAKTDSDAMEYLIEKYQNFIASIVSIYYLAGASHEDLLQEGRIAFVEAVFRYRSDRSFLSFARLVIKRRIFSLIRHSKTQGQRAMENFINFSELVPDSKFWDDNIEGRPIDEVIYKMENKEFFTWLSQNLSELEYKIAICLIKGMGIGTIYLHLHQPYKTIDNAIQRIRRKIRSIQEEMDFYAQSTGMCRPAWAQLPLTTATG